MNYRLKWDGSSRYQSHRSVTYSGVTKRAIRSTCIFPLPKNAFVDQIKGCQRLEIYGKQPCRCNLVSTFCISLETVSTTPSHCARGGTRSSLTTQDWFRPFRLGLCLSIHAANPTVSMAGSGFIRSAAEGSFQFRQKCVGA